MTNEHYIHSFLVATGALVIRDDGTIWRHFRISNKGDRALTPVEPHRAELEASYGYWRIASKILNRRVQVFAHRLVYFHFFGDIPEGLTINHKNGDKRDNRPSNLEAITQGDNIIHSWHVLQRGKEPPIVRFIGLSHPMARFSREEVIAIRNRLRAGEGVNEISKSLGLTSVLPVSRINLGISYRDVLEKKIITFPIKKSKFKPNPRTVCAPLPAEQK